MSDLLRIFFLLIAIFLQFPSGFSDDSNVQKDTKKSKKGSTVLIICIGLAVVVGLSAYLYKLWQKKKRDEQHARLLKLFEEDDDLDFELEGSFTQAWRKRKGSKGYYSAQKRK